MTIDEFQKADLRVGKIIAAERVDGSEKLLKLQIDIGEVRQILSGIAKYYAPEDLIGKEVVIIANLDPRVFTLRQGSGQVGMESQGMLLAAHGEEGEPVILGPLHEVPPGAKIG
jgi:methionine--tRNA ligase beta chain